jgi:DNA-binding transcriptional LysR family regulator
MQLTALRYFHETARLGSIRKAADTLRVSPSAISRQIMHLEHDLKAPLFERSVQGVRLTAAGDLLAQQTQRTFRDLDRVRSAVDDLRGLRRGQVTACVIEGLVAEFLPAVLRDFHDLYPNISFNIICASTDRSLDALVRDETDIAMTFNAPPRPDIITICEYVQPLACLVAIDHPLAGESSLLLKDIMNFPLALPDPTFGLRQAIDRAISRLNLKPPIFLNTDSLELIKNMAITGRAVAFMPAVMVAGEIAQGTLRAIPIADIEFESARTSICVHRDRQLPFAAREFQKFLAEKLMILSSTGAFHIQATG